MQLAPEPMHLNDQTEKIERAISIDIYREAGSKKRKPTIADFIFFAAAQRAADRVLDGST